MSDTPPRTTREIYTAIIEECDQPARTTPACLSLTRIRAMVVEALAAHAALPWVTRPPAVTKTLVKRDYWAGESYRPYTNGLYQEGVQIAASDLIREMLSALTDGDEFAISVTVTGNRPFGDRRIVYQEPHKYGEETDEQYTARVEPSASLGRADGVTVKRLYASGGTNGVHDYEMSDGSIQTLSVAEAREKRLADGEGDA